VRDDSGAECVETTGELTDGDKLTAANPRDQREVTARQKADIFSILSIDLFKSRCDDESNAGGELAIGSGLARRTAPFGCPADDNREATAGDCVGLDATGPKPDVTIATE
jgi:hypothetical protein